MQVALKIQTSRITHQSGIALMEALIALGVLTLGVLALLVVQLRLFNEVTMSTGRNQATIFIDDLAERIKANPAGWDANSPVLTNALFTNSGWNTPTPATPPSSIKDCGAPAATDGTTVTCTPDELALFDLWRFKRNLSQTLPLGDARLSVAGDPTQIAVIVAWRRNEKGTLGDDTSDTNQLNKTIDINIFGTSAACDTGKVCHLAYIPRIF